MQRETTMKRTAALPFMCAVLAALCGGGMGSTARADATATLDVDVDKPGVAIPKTFYGLMTEEINHSYDGGLFAELIQNRTFQDPRPRGAADRRRRPAECVTAIADPLVADR